MDVVIVGGGPVGLWTAIQLKLRQPDWKICVYERHKEYQRSHVLRLDHWSMLLYGRLKHTAFSKERRSLYYEISDMQISDMALAPAGSLFIRTNDLEDALLKHARMMGIEIRYELVWAVDQMHMMHPECKRFIAADGAKSKMRSDLLPLNGLKFHNLRNIVEVKFDAYHATAASAKSLFVTNTRLNSMVFEYIGKDKGDHIVPVTLRFFVDDAIYAKMGTATFAEPKIVGKSTPHVLANDIYAYIKEREIIPGTELRLTKLQLSMYAARKFAVIRGDACWFLVGDAAMGVPYFRALNSGMILGSRLAQIVGTNNWPVSGKLWRQKALYRVHQPLHVWTEFAIARGKDALLSGYDMARQAVGSSQQEEAAIM